MSDFGRSKGPRSVCRSPLCPRVTHERKGVQTLEVSPISRRVRVTYTCVDATVESFGGGRGPIQ